jgi:hypothetical protein
MSRTIAPGQTVPIPFTLSETPDSTPIVAAVEQATTDGIVADITATVSPTVTQRGVGLLYYAWFTTPADAEHGTAFTVTLAVSIGGETTFHDLDGGTVELWASQASVTANGAAIAGVPAGVWTHPTRRLTMSASALAAVAGDEPVLSILRGDTIAEPITGLGDLTTATQIWVTIKRYPSDADAAAIAQVKQDGGLIALNGSSNVTAGDGSIDVDDDAAGDITFRLAAAASAMLGPNDRLRFDVQVQTPDGIDTRRSGVCIVEADVTRATEA